MTQPPFTKLATSTSDVLTGAGVGATAGLLSTLFKKDRKIRDYVKRALVGGGVGAAAGVGLGGLRQGSEPAPPSTSEPAKPRLGGRSAALAGLFPIAGPAIYGAVKSQEGDKLSNALKLGGTSWASALPGHLIASRSAAGGKYNAGTHLLGALLSMAGSSYGTRAMADHIDKSV